MRFSTSICYGMGWQVRITNVDTSAFSNSEGASSFGVSYRVLFPLTSYFYEVGVHLVGKVRRDFDEVLDSLVVFQWVAKGD